MTHKHTKLTNALWYINNRPERPSPWTTGGNLPWDDPDFSRRMLREHLDDSHGAASRQTTERELLLDWLWGKLDLQSGQHLLDVTCGPGLYDVELARRGLQVTGVDFGPASIEYAKRLAVDQGVAGHCQFIQQDVRQMEMTASNFEAALFLYGQLAVFTREEAQSLLTHIAQSLRPGGRLVVELLNQDRVDKTDSNWWFTDDKGLWGDAPFLHLGERFWYADEQLSYERFHILHLETGQMDEVHLCDQTYAVAEMTAMMQTAGFTSVDVYPAWDGLALYDAEEWVVYLAQK